MKLVLAEKPSVAQSIAKVLGAAKREDGYLEGNGYPIRCIAGSWKVPTTTSSMRISRRCLILTPDRR